MVFRLRPTTPSIWHQFPPIRKCLPVSQWGTTRWTTAIRHHEWCQPTGRLLRAVSTKNIREGIPFAAKTPPERGSELTTFRAICPKWEALTGAGIWSKQGRWPSISRVPLRFVVICLCLQSWQFDQKGRLWEQKLAKRRLRRSRDVCLTQTKESWETD